MLGDNLDVKVLKYGLICILSFLAFIIIFIIKMITGSYLIGTLFFIGLVWILIFKIGITIMYPGSSNYYTSDIQIRIGNELAKNLQHLGHCFQFIAECINQRKVQFTASQWNLKEKVLGNLHSTIQMLSMFQHNLSDRKYKMLQIFRQLLEQLQYRHSSNSLPLNETSTQMLKSITEFMEFPKKIRFVQGEVHTFLCDRAKNILMLNNNLQQMILTYRPPEKTFDFLKYKFFAEKFYEVRFGFQRWNHIFQYEVHLVQNYGYVLQSAVIKKNRIQQRNIPNNQDTRNNDKYVLFCNPNGVYIQFFAVQNTYVRQYLKQGYKIILWNYRGYGQSTGSPSITKSQTDAIKIYHYFTQKGMNIQIVHGYSIGGCAAIGLVHKLQKNNKNLNRSGRQQVSALRSQNLPNNVKLIIVDRSFSSIGDMAIQFGKTLHRLARIVFTFQNKNLSKQFTEIKTQKLLLWDKHDEVIPETASVKGGILLSTLGIEEESSCKNCSNCMKHEEQNPLNQEVSVLINQRDQDEELEVNKRFVHRFTSALKVLLKQSCQIQKTGDLQLNTNHEYDPTQFSTQDNYGQKTNQNINVTEQTINSIFNVLQFIDGGGTLLPHPVNQFRKLLKNNPDLFEYKCQSFLIGLAYYGSVLPNEIAFQKKSEIQLHTLKKIQELIKCLNKISSQTGEQNRILEPSLNTGLQNLKLILTDLKSIVETKFLLPQNRKFGKLLALSSGHNGSLSHQQLRLLMKYVGKVCNDSEGGVNINRQREQNGQGGMRRQVNREDLIISDERSENEGIREQKGKESDVVWRNQNQKKEGVQQIFGSEQGYEQIEESNERLQERKGSVQMMSMNIEKRSQTLNSFLE